MDKEKVMEILMRLEGQYGGMGCALNYNSPFELLIATMLSAQTTDITVNKATEILFKRYNKPSDFSSISEEELHKYIKTCGFYRVKGKHIIEASREILNRFNGKVPDNLEDLISLPGVGRKTANVVLSNAFGKNTIAVDTHVFRVANRIGLANSKDVYGTEIELMENLPKEYWSRAHHYIIWHGRRVCSSKKPKCRECMLFDLCEWSGKEI